MNMNTVIDMLIANEGMVLHDIKTTSVIRLLELGRID